jgi:hypothetical protein
LIRPEKFAPPDYPSNFAEVSAISHRSPSSEQNRALVCFDLNLKGASMKQLTVLTALAVLALTTQVPAEEIKSGLEPGKAIGAFNVTKCAGAEEDGVKVGDNLCYRCKNGARPQVMVFTRSANDKNVQKLIQELDKAVAENSDKQLRAFVNVLGEDKEELSSSAKELAQATKAKNVPFVVPNEFENGPDDYGLNSEAEVTIIVANKSKVTATHAAKAAKDLKVDAVLADVKKLVE